MRSLRPLKIAGHPAPRLDGVEKVRYAGDPVAAVLAVDEAAADVGRAINPVQCEGQDEGAVFFALGHRQCRGQGRGRPPLRSSSYAGKSMARLAG